MDPRRRPGYCLRYKHRAPENLALTAMEIDLFESFVLRTDFKTVIFLRFETDLF
jgi:hypothetical protein